jgi:uncharacterized protein (DUF2252 family)
MPRAKTPHQRPPLPTVAERQAAGVAAREACPPKMLAGWTAPPDRGDPIAILEGQSTTRLKDLVPIRYGRMSVDAFTFLRGTAAIMASDFSNLPSPGLNTQLCGDCHLYNFGAYASPERELLFDVNDFDETLPGPFEWDLRRLATSFVTASRVVGFSAKTQQLAASAAARSYREVMAGLAEMGELQVWYDRIGEQDIMKTLSGAARGYAEEVAAKARKKDNLQALAKLTEVRDGALRIKYDAPLLLPADDIKAPDELFRAVELYRESLPDDRRKLLERYRAVDFARKVVGVGSVGTRCWIVLGLGRDDNDPLFLQIKEAGESVLEPYCGKSEYGELHGRRVVEGQRLMQSASDIFLGWGEGPDGVRYYWRQLRDMKGSVTIENMDEPGIVLYAGVCGWALAYAHARGGDRIAISAYMKGPKFDKAIGEFAMAYADQNEADYALFKEAIRRGRIDARTGL